MSIERSRAFLDYLALAKPEITFLAMLTAVTGFLLGSSNDVAATRLLVLIMGTGLVGAGCGALNQYIERRPDGLMKRTQHRPLPSGRLTPRAALVGGIVCSLSGVLVLAALSNRLSGLLAVATVALYLFVYTPLKRITWAATLVGAIPGALPPVIGWVAATGELDGTSLALFTLLYLWQMPHFWSLAWMYRKDYQRAGYRFLPVIDPDGRRTGTGIAVFSALLIPASWVLSWPANLGVLYIAGALLASGGFLIVTLRHLALRTSLSGRLVFLSSLIYLPLLLVLMLLSRLV